jgi:hypothetical protein
LLSFAAGTVHSSESVVVRVLAVGGHVQDCCQGRHNILIDAASFHF